MELQGFSSIFEIFATFTLAYIIIDELSENPFISLICEKFLRKYSVIEDTRVQIKGQLSGRATSLNNLAQFNLNQVQKDELKDIRLVLRTIEERCEQSFSELKLLIRQNHATRAFVYLNTYLFLYCLTILLYGGMFASVKDHNEQDLQYNLQLNNSLFFLNSLSIILLVGGWFFDNKKETENDASGNPKIKINGYTWIILFFILTSLICILAFYFNWKILDFNNQYLHRSLILSCVFIPISNFIIYFIKAGRKANKIIAHLKQRANQYKTDYLAELNPIDNFIGHCRYTATEIKGSNTEKKDNDIPEKDSVIPQSHMEQSSEKSPV
jgi:hypothetical protein